MRLALTEDDVAFRSAVRDAIGAAWEPASVRSPVAERDRRVRTVWRHFRQLGLVGLSVPSDRGGSGARLRDAMPAALEVGRSLLPFPLLDNAVLAPDLLHGCGTAAAADLADRVLGGEAVATVCWPAPERAAPLTATVAGLRYADQVLVPGAGAERVEIRAVPVAELPAAEDGDPVDSCWDVHRLPWRDLAERAGEPVGAVPASSLRSLSAAAAALRNAEAVGGMQALLAATVAYARVRQQFGRPIGAQQAVQHHLASMATACYLAECAALSAWEQRDSAMATTAELSWYTAGAYLDLAEQALQVHGAIGFTWECDVHLYLRHALQLGNASGSATT